MNGDNMQLAQVKKKIKTIEKQINRYDTEIEKLPEGSIACYQNGKYSKWFHLTEEGRVHIKKKNKELASKLAYKKYLQARVKDLRVEMELLKDSLTKITLIKEESSFTVQLIENPLYSDLLTGMFTPSIKKYQQWTCEDYKRNMRFPEQLTKSTLSGIKVRSKSEQAIERILTIHKIPFRYEPEYEMNGSIFYPDFLIIHPRTGEFFIWEHFGLMDDLDYAHKTFRKLDLYHANGFTIGERLIATFEKMSMPFGLDEAEDIVWKTFLL